MMNDATTLATTRTDKRDGFTRTALTISSAQVGSLDLIDASGTLLARVNVTLSGDGRLVVDTIDVDKRYTQVKGIVFSAHDRSVTSPVPQARLVSADFSLAAVVAR